MLFRLVRPVKRSGSSNRYFVKRIPADLQERMVGLKLAIPIGDETTYVVVSAKMESIRLSLRASDPLTIRQRQADASNYVDSIFESLRRNKPIALSLRQAVALAGRLYRAWASDPDAGVVSIVWNGEEWQRDDYLTAEELEAGYEATLRRLRPLVGVSHEELERALGHLADNMLVKEGITSLDPPSRRKLLPELLKAIVQGMEVGERKAGGDYRPDPRAERFPEWRPPEGESAEKSQSTASLKGLVETWWREAKAAGFSESTYASYAKAVTALGAFLKHDDATKITPDEIVAFKDHLGASPYELSAKTIKDSYLAGIRSVFEWAVRNRKLVKNPAQGITIKVAKRRKVRDTWFSSAEISAILSAASEVQREPKESSQRHALKRWVPWLCAYTGARVGEIVQLRKQDVRDQDGVWTFSITPEAGTVKDKERRDVPVHRHLIDMGFVDFVKGASQGQLFMWSGSGRAAWRTAKNHVTRFVRTLVKDPHVQPNHAWRHTFKTIGSEAGIQDKVLDAICGHDPRTVGEGYGGVTLKAKARAMNHFPKYRVNR